MLNAVARTLAQLSDPAIVRVFRDSILGALAAIAALAAVIWLALAHLWPTGIAWLDHSAVRVLVDTLGGFAVMVLAWLMFPALVGTVAGFFLERVARAVERRYYPALPAPREQPMTEMLATGLRFFAVMVVLNLAALPLYLLPGMNLALYYGLNGYLLGRQYYEMIALRRMDAATAARLRRAHGARIFVAGAAIAFVLTIPLANLLVPVLATAFMVHVVAGLQRSGPYPATA